MDTSDSLSLRIGWVRNRLDRTQLVRKGITSSKTSLVRKFARHNMLASMTYRTSEFTVYALAGEPSRFSKGVDASGTTIGSVRSGAKCHSPGSISALLTMGTCDYHLRIKYRFEYRRDCCRESETGAIDDYQQEGAPLEARPLCIFDGADQHTWLHSWRGWRGLTVPQLTGVSHGVILLSF